MGPLSPHGSFILVFLEHVQPNAYIALNESRDGLQIRSTALERKVADIVYGWSFQRSHYCLERELVHENIRRGTAHSRRDAAIGTACRCQQYADVQFDG